MAQAGLKGNETILTTSTEFENYSEEKERKNAVNLTIYVVFGHHEFQVGHVCWRQLFPSQFFTKLLLCVWSRKETAFGHRIETLQTAVFLY